MVIKTATNIAQNGSFTTTYVDGTDAIMANITSPAGAVSITSLSWHTGNTLYVASGTKIESSSAGFEIDTTNTTYFGRINAKFIGSYVITGLNYSLNQSYTISPANVEINIYGSNDVACYNDVTSSTTGLSSWNDDWYILSKLCHIKYYKYS